MQIIEIFDPTRESNQRHQAQQSCILSLRHQGSHCLGFILQDFCIIYIVLTVLYSQSK